MSATEPGRIAPLVEVDALVEKVREVAAENPEHRYEIRAASPTPCSYFEETNIEVGVEEAQWVPSCIVGHALYRLGVTYDVLRENGVENGGGIMELGPIVKNLYDESREFSWLLMVQDQQDDGTPWAEAVARADADLAAAEEEQA